MKIQQIRNAMVRIRYAGKTFLTDPWLAPRGSMGTFRDYPMFRCRPERLDLPLPLCDLPMPVADILTGVDAYIVTHVHPDHIDMAADGSVGAPLDKAVPVFVQSEEDAAVLRRSGFARVEVLGEETVFAGLRLSKTPGRHGTIIPCGPSCGVVFRHPDEKTLYVAGDTIWFDGVAESLRRYRPDVVVVNACAAELLDEGRLIMDDADVAALHAARPEARIIVSHMDTVPHAALTRQDMDQALRRRGIREAVFMPDDGQSADFLRQENSVRPADGRADA